jgi:flagellar protein FlbT
MALNLSLKPREKLVVNGAVLRNSSSRHPLTLEFLNKVNFMREREIIMPEQAVTPLLRVIYWLQIMYIDPDQRSVAEQRFMELAQELHDAVAEPNIRLAIAASVSFMLQQRFGAALKVLKDALPFERALLGMTASDQASSVVTAVRRHAGDAPGLDTAITEELLQPGDVA